MTGEVNYLKSFSAGGAQPSNTVVVNPSGDSNWDDSLAIQSAIDSLKNNNGGRVILGAGIFNCKSTIVVPECHNLGPDAGLGHYDIDIVGQGQWATVLYAPVDLGAGVPLLSCGDPTGNPSNKLGRYGDNSRYVGLFADFLVQGPGYPTYNPGQKPSQMDGIAWGSMRRMERVFVCGFNNGISVVGDHSNWFDVQSFWNYYNLYYPEPNEVLWGDLTMTRCYYDAGTFASVGIHDKALITGHQFIGCRFGGSPYGFYGEAGPVGQAMMSGVEFIGGMTEYGAYEAIFDGNFDGSDAGTLKRGISRVNLQNHFFGNGDQGIIDGKTRYAMIVASRIDQLTITRTSTQDTNQPGSLAYFISREVSQVYLDGGVDHLIYYCNANNVPIWLGQDLFAIASVTWKEGSDEGQIITANNAVTSGQVLEPSGFGVQAGDANNLPVAGIARNNAAQYAPCFVTQKSTGAAIPMTSAVTNQMLYKAANGGVTTVSGTTPVGYALFSYSSSSARVSLS